jgi:hypothetical protein
MNEHRRKPLLRFGNGHDTALKVARKILVPVFAATTAFRSPLIRVVTAGHCPAFLYAAQ